MSAKQGRKFCLNCGNELKGCYCHECGQRSDNFHRSLKKLFLHFLDEFFTFDSKFFRSFIPFIFKPGRLTNEYLSGKQVSYVAPFRLYFFTVIVFLFIQGIWNPYQVVDVESDSSIISFKSGENSSDKVSSEEQTEAETETEAKEPVEFSDEMKEFLKENGRNSEKSTHNSSKKDDDFFAKIASNAADLKNDAEARKRFVSRFFHMIPNMLIVLMPFFALILKMLHLRWKEFYYVDHLVFSLHFHAFGFFLLTILAPLQQFFNVGPALTISLLVYLFLALRRVYRRSRWRTTIKTFLIFIFYGILLSIGLVAVVVIEVINMRS